MIKRKILGKAQALIAALGLALALVFTGCGNGGGSGGGGRGFLGTTLELSGQVYLAEWDDDDNHTLTPYTGTRAITSAGFWYGCCCFDNEEWRAVGGSGTITEGQLSFTVGTPPAAAMVNIDYFFDDDFEEVFNNFNISNRNARIAVIEALRTTGGRYVDRFRATPYFV